jgi:hypothetical protein
VRSSVATPSRPFPPDADKKTQQIGADNWLDRGRRGRRAPALSLIAAPVVGPRRAA